MATPTKRLGDVIVLSTFFVTVLSVGFLGGVFFDNPHAPTIFIHPAVDSFESLNLPRASLGILGENSRTPAFVGIHIYQVLVISPTLVKQTHVTI